jgi:hypothetical protein
VPTPGAAVTIHSRCSKKVLATGMSGLTGDVRRDAAAGEICASWTPCFSGIEEP